MRKATVSFVRIARPSFLPHGTSRLPLDGFSCNLMLEYFSKIQVSLKSGKNDRYFTLKTHVHLWLYLAHFFLGWEMFRTKVVENIKKHIFMFNNFFSAENHAVYEIMWKNIVEPGRPHMTRWRMRIACWTAKTETHTQDTSCFSTATVVARTRLSVTLYLHCLSCFCIWVGEIYGETGCKCDVTVRLDVMGCVSSLLLKARLLFFFDWVGMFVFTN